MSQGLYLKYRMLWMDPLGGQAFSARHAQSHCCASMIEALTHRCEQHAEDPFECPDLLIAYSPTFDEYGLIIHDGGASTLLIEHCPWCGTKLPASQRDRWFDELVALGFKNPHGDDIPDSYKCAEWRQPKG